MDLIKYFINKIKKDNIFLEAASLSYTTTLALVPALTVILSIFTMIPAFEPLKEELKNFATSNFLPVFSSAVADYIDLFISKAAQMTITGIIALFVISLLLIRSVDTTINKIFKGGKRKLSMTFAIYWTLLTVGPLALGIIISLSSRLIALTLMYDNNELSLSIRFIYLITPIIIELIVFCAIYMIVPTVNVRFKDALLTAILVTVAFELAKKIFSIFILNFSSYETIYGALAAIPVVMIWININWILTLIGAQFCSSLHLARKGTGEDVPKSILSLAQATGDIVGSSVHIANKHKKRIKIKVSELDE